MTSSTSLKMAESMQDPAAGKYHLDKRIPVVQILALFLGLLSQAAVALWWARGLEGEVALVDSKVQIVASELSAVEARASNRMLTVETRVERVAQQGEPLRLEIVKLNGNIERLVQAIEQGKEGMRELNARVRDLERQEGRVP